MIIDAYHRIFPQKSNVSPLLFVVSPNAIKVARGDFGVSYGDNITKCSDFGLKQDRNTTYCACVMTSTTALHTKKTRMYAKPTDFDATSTINTRKSPDIDVQSTVHAPKRSGGYLSMLHATLPQIRNTAMLSCNATKCVRDGAIEYVDAMKTSVATLPISFFILNILLHL